MPFTKGHPTSKTSPWDWGGVLGGAKQLTGFLPLLKQSIRRYVALPMRFKKTQCQGLSFQQLEDRLDHTQGAQKQRSEGLQSLMATWLRQATKLATIIKLGWLPRKQTLRMAEIYTEGLSYSVPQNQHQWEAREEGLD